MLLLEPGGPAFAAEAAIMVPPGNPHLSSALDALVSRAVFPGPVGMPTGNSRTRAPNALR
jgi:hypothetical protein